MLKKILNISIVVFMITILFVNCSENSITTNSNFKLSEPVKIGVLLYKFDDEYISLIRKNLEEKCR